MQHQVERGAGVATGHGGGVVHVEQTLDFLRHRDEAGGVARFAGAAACVRGVEQGRARRDLVGLDAEAVVGTVQHGIGVAGDGDVQGVDVERAWIGEIGQVEERVVRRIGIDLGDHHVSLGNTRSSDGQGGDGAGDKGFEDA